MSALRMAVCLAMLFPAALCGQTASKGSTVCKPLPPDIERRLSEQFHSWEIQKPKNLSATARERWESEIPEACPGMAEGRFAGGTALSYAILLVPREHPDTGYKFLVFSSTPGKSSYEATVVEQSDQAGANNFFIHRVSINKFFNEASRKKFAVAASDGILLADAGANEYQTDVYFWADGRYQHQPVDY